MCSEYYVNGYLELNKLLEKLHSENFFDEKIFIFFTGTKLPETGKSWCPDCVKGNLKFFCFIIFF